MNSKECHDLIEMYITSAKNFVQQLEPETHVRPSREIRMEHNLWNDQLEAQYNALLTLHQSIINQFNRMLTTLKEFEDQHMK